MSLMVNELKANDIVRISIYDSCSFEARFISADEKEIVVDINWNTVIPCYGESIISINSFKQKEKVYGCIINISEIAMLKMVSRAEERKQAMEWFYRQMECGNIKSDIMQKAYECAIDIIEKTL